MPRLAFNESAHEVIHLWESPIIPSKKFSHSLDPKQPSNIDDFGLALLWDLTQMGDECLGPKVYHADITKLY